MTLTCSSVALFLLPLQSGCWRGGEEEVCVHVTLLMLQCWGFLPGPPQGGRAEPRHGCHSALAAGGEGTPGRQAQRWDRLVPGESLPRTEHPKVDRKQIRHPETSQKAQWELREERAVKSRRSAPILTKLSFLPAPSRQTLKPHPRLHLCHTQNPSLEVMGGYRGSVSLWSHARRRAGVCQTLAHRNRFEESQRMDSCSLFPA